MDHDTEFVLLCWPQDRQTLALLGENFRPVAETAPNYSISEQFKIPWALRRERVELFHAPHYVLPRLVSCRSVVTIHDCIHLMFPQYLPSRLALALCADLDHDGVQAGQPRADGLGELEAGHPALRRRARRQDRRDLQRLRRAVRRGASRRGRHSRPRAISAARRVRAVRRQRQAAQESRTADRRLPHRPQPRPRPPQAGADRRRDFEVRGAPARRAPAPVAQVRPLPRLPSRGDAGGDVPAGRCVRVSVVVRRVRAASARGDGERHAGGDVECLVAPRGGRRRGPARRSVRSGGDRRRDLHGPHRRVRPPRPAAERDRPGEPVLMGAVGAPGPGNLSRGRGGPRV